MSNELAVIRPTDDWSDVLPAVGDLAGKISGTSFVPSTMRGKPAEVAACILTGREIGIGPMEALQKIHVIEGRPTLSAELMRAQVFRAGHHIRIVNVDSESVTVEGRRKGDEQWTRVTFSMDDARAAGLDRRPNWSKHRRAMLSARATSELCRLIFPDALGGISYTPDEVADMPDDAVTPTRVTLADLRPSTVVDAVIVDDEPSSGLDEFAAETTSNPPENIEPLLTSAQNKAIHAHLSSLGIKDRDAGLRFLSAAIGRDIESSKEIRKSEASTLLDEWAQEKQSPPPSDDLWADVEVATPGGAE